MAAFHYFPAFHFLSSHKIFFPSKLSSPSLCKFHPRNCCLRFYAAVSKKSSASKKKVKSDSSLCDEIREFLSTAGFPEDHVPTMKDFSQHGRDDLANIVRRRGYKLIKQLLQTSTTTNFSEPNIGTEISGDFDVLFVPEGQNEKLNALTSDLLSCDNVQEDFHRPEIYPNDQISFALSENTAVLQEKVTKFVRHGDLDYVDGPLNIFENNEINTDEGETTIESEDTFEFTSSVQSNIVPNFLNFSNVEISNGNAPAPVEKLEYSVLGNDNSSNGYIYSEEATKMAHNDNDLNSEKPYNENLDEVEHLKSLLREKELELHCLKQQIEMEKEALSALQAQAESQMNNSSTLISEKDIELDVVEGSLSGLKEVEVQYSGDGQHVELAGSFNGWHHKVKMDPLPVSSTVHTSGLRTSQLWKTVLWLYPGIYEIKFIVDGHWRTDPSMQLITRDSIQNNMLKVD